MSVLFLFLLLAFIFFFNSCTPYSVKFALKKPITHLGDTLHVPIPEKTRFSMLKYGVDASVRLPIFNALDTKEIPPSQDVNSLDQLVTSSWYTPRLGFKQISPEGLVNGAFKIGPPQKPLTVIKAKKGGNNPGFIIKDARGYNYLIKFDPPEFPGVETTTALIVNRLFWAFGYNVPEDYLYFFRKTELSIDSSGELSEADVEDVLSKVAIPRNGYFSCTASLFISGKILGGTLDHGVNKSDLNDKIPHENLRILRAMKVFGAFTNHVGMRPDNSLDVYIGEPGKGYVKHYLLDFGEALGGHGAGRQVLWNGFEHYFSFEEMAKNLITFGFWIKPWENTDFTQWKSIGPFEAEAFDPKTWKEITQYQPMQMSLPEDDYWAAKVIGSLSYDHINALVKATQYPEEGATEYMVQTLLKRRQKILDYFLYQVTPVESKGIKDSILEIYDMGRIFKASNCADYSFVVQFFDSNNNEIAPASYPKILNSSFQVKITNSLLKKASDYLIVKVKIQGNNSNLPPAAQFHIRSDPTGIPLLVGVIH